MPAPHHSFYRPDACPSCRPTNSVKALKALRETETDFIKHTCSLEGLNC